MYQMGADMTLEVNRLARFTDEGTTPVDPGDFVSTVGHTRIQNPSNSASIKIEAIPKQAS